MIDQKEGETEMKVKIHYDDMVGKIYVYKVLISIHLCTRIVSRTF